MKIETEQKITNVLKQRGVSVKELARQIGKSDKAIYKFIKGESHPSLDTLCAIALALECKLDDLYEYRIKE
jgi:transcriptional regulator with XRE-family HTH domain